MTRRKLAGTTGLGLGSDTSQMRFLPPTWNSLIFSEVEAAASCVSVHPACASASRRRSSPPDAGEEPGSAALAGPADSQPPMPPAAQRVMMRRDLACLSARR